MLPKYLVSYFKGLYFKHRNYNELKISTDPKHTYSLVTKNGISYEVRKGRDIIQVLLIKMFKYQFVYW